MGNRRATSVAFWLSVLLFVSSVTGVFSLVASGNAQEAKKDVGEKPELKKELGTAKILKALEDIDQKIQRLDERLKALEKPALPLPKVKGGKVPVFAQPGGQIRGTGLKVRSREQYKAAVEKLVLKHPNKTSVSLRSIVVTADPPSDYDVRKELQRLYPNKIRFAVQDQRQCGSCWDFAAVAAFEANFALKSGQEALPSEQFILNCCSEQTGNDRADCGGGALNTPLQFLLEKGTPSRITVPYNDPAVAEGCNTGIPSVYFAANIGAVEGPNRAFPGVREIQRQVTDRGAVLVSLFVNVRFQRLGLIDPCPEDLVWDEQVEPLFNALGEIINGHAVAIVGWDNTKSAWLIKNSWSPGWGHKGGFGAEGGYLWMKFGISHIGEEVWFVEAKTPPQTIGAPVITSAASASGTPGVAFSYQITATNTPTSFAADGLLPAGLTFNTTTGVISGTPTVAGTSSITLGAKNALGTGTAILTLSVGCPTPPTPPAIPNFNANVLNAIDYWTKNGYPPPK